MKKILIILAALGIIGAAIGYYLYTKPLTGMDELSADIIVPATQLYSEFEQDEQKANSIYIGKVLEVEGKLLNIETSEQGGISLILDAGGIMGGVVCRMDPKSDVTSNSIQSGELVTLRGECIGLSSDVELARCVLISNN